MLAYLVSLTVNTNKIWPIGFRDSLVNHDILQYNKKINIVNFAFNGLKYIEPKRMFQIVKLPGPWKPLARDFALRAHYVRYAHKVFVSPYLKILDPPLSQGHNTPLRTCIDFHNYVFITSTALTTIFFLLIQKLCAQKQTREPCSSQITSPTCPVVLLASIY